jgi:hypothetical protein
LISWLKSWNINNDEIKGNDDMDGKKAVAVVTNRNKTDQSGSRLAKPEALSP